jgi:hypothetical protein
MSFTGLKGQKYTQQRGELAVSVALLLTATSFRPAWVHFYLYPSPFALPSSLPLGCLFSRRRPDSLLRRSCTPAPKHGFCCAVDPNATFLCGLTIAAGTQVHDHDEHISARSRRARSSIATTSAQVCHYSGRAGLPRCHDRISTPLPCICAAVVIVYLCRRRDRASTPSP